MTPPPLYDAHNHLQDEWLRPHRDTIFAELARMPLRGAVVNGTEENDWPEVVRLAAEHAWILPSFGLHPWRVKGRSARWKESLERHVQAAGPRVAIGEIGLDRWIPDHDLDDQREVFVWQLRLAVAHELPVTIHCLQAWGALDEVLRNEAVPARGFLVHAYGGPAERVGGLAKRGAYFSFNGAHLDARKAARREVFRAVPLERLLVETDAPAMPSPPEFSPFELPPTSEGKRVNHPANIVATYAALAELRGMAVEQLAGVAETNFHRLFG